MAVSGEFLQFVLEQLAGLGELHSRRMFSGVGLYCGGTFFGLIAGDVLYFKVDDATRADYEACGMAPFRPYRDRPDVSFRYYAVPVDALEDPEECVRWARRAVAVAAQPPPRRTRRAARGTPRSRGAGSR